MKKFNVQIYGDSCLAEDNSFYITNVDPGQVAKEFYIGDLLEAFDFMEIEAWVMRKRREDEEDRIEE